MTTAEALEADLRAWNAAPGALVQTARQIALAIDSEPSPQELQRLSAELRLLLKEIKAACRPQTTELDDVLSRVTATDFQ